MKCISGFYLSEDGKSCVTSENCLEGNKGIGICEICNDNYYLDYKDGKCKSNQEENEFYFCQIAENNFCSKCINGYYLGEDLRCSNAVNCSESNNGLCEVCIDNYFLTNDKKCVNVEHCIKSDKGRCVECEDNLFYSFLDDKCLKAEGKFENCKYSVNNCLICKDDYYLNQSDYFCYNNNLDNEFNKCTLTNTKGDTCIACAHGYSLNVATNRCSKQ